MTNITEIIPFGKQEPEMSKQTKQLYCIVQHDNPLKKINFKEFITKLKEYVEIYDFDWTCKHENGRKCYPRYDKKECAKDWPKRYDYSGAYRTYAEYQNGESGIDLLLLEKTLQDNDIRELLIISEGILHEIKEMPQDQKYEYRRKASIETYVMIMNEIRKRLGIDEENLNIKSENVHTNLNLNADNETEEERLDRYADYFERINRKATSVSSKDNTG